MSGELIPVGNWPDLVQYGRDAGKKPASTISNLMFLLNKLNIKVRYNVISKDLEIDDPNETYNAFDGGKNAAINAIISWACRFGMPKGDVPQYLEAIGYKNQYNPVLEWIESEPYDGALNYVEMLCKTITPRFDFSEEFKDILIKKWLLSCVAMLCNDDAHHWSKGVLTFQGRQDLGKTSWFWKLFPSDHQEWGKEGVVLKPDEKDSVTAAITHWIIELGELEATFKKSDIARIKAFLTNRKDKIRMPYDRKESIFPRRTSFFASVNPSEFLRDATGNVRFWVIPTIDINFKHEINIQQVWAQTYAAYQHGASWHLDADEAKTLEDYNESAREMSPIEEMILSAVPFGPAEATATRILKHYLGVDNPTQRDKNICGDVLRKLYGDPIRRGDGRFFQFYEKKQGED
jgi:putative DNA primase/helicase